MNDQTITKGNIFGFIIKVMSGYAFARCVSDGKKMDVFLHPSTFAAVELQPDGQTEIFTLVGNGDFEHRADIVARLESAPSSCGAAWPAAAWAYRSDWAKVVARIHANGHDSHVVSNGSPTPERVVVAEKPHPKVENISASRVPERPPDGAPIEDVLLWQAMGGANAGVKHPRFIKHNGPFRGSKYGKRH